MAIVATEDLQSLKKIKITTESGYRDRKLRIS